MLDVFKTLTSGILEKAKTFKGDWNENNSSSPNYIKNRPFYSEIGDNGAEKVHKLDEKYIPDSVKTTKTSELTNDSGFITSIPDEYITETELTAKNYIDNTTLEGKGYLTEHQDLSSYALKTELHSHDNKTVLDTITDTKITEWDSKSTFSGSYNDLTDKPTIPSIEGLATEQYVNNMISFNDAGELVVTINGVSKTFVAKTE